LERWPDRQSAGAGHGDGQEFGLVIASFAQAFGMQRHWDQGMVSG
jgi:hypothetical protein